MSIQAVLLYLILLHLLLFIHLFLCLSHSLARLANANPSPLRGPVVVDASPSPLRSWRPAPLPLPWAASRCLSLSPRHRRWLAGGQIVRGKEVRRRGGLARCSSPPFLSSPLLRGVGGGTRWRGLDPPAPELGTATEARRMMRTA
ncbi:hypothetical protein DAI22_08g126600 [Oryza sativa Japonica Group]|nr:hypothetical protein DAI22_08g126600 [Oryza sativa Japonica Group]